MKTITYLFFALLFSMLLFLCTNDDVVFNPPADHYVIQTTLKDSLSGTMLADSVYPGQKVLFSGIFLKGDSSKVTPYWNLKPSARYSFYYTFTSACDFPVIFTVRDKAGFTLSDTLIVHVRKIDDALISGSVFLYGEKDHRNIKVTFRDASLHDTVFQTDSNGQYAKNSRIAAGAYTIIAEEVRSGYIYKSVSLNVNITKGQLTQIRDTTLNWSYAITPDNIFLPNDTIITPFVSMSFPVDITDMHGSIVNAAYSVSRDNSQLPGILSTPSYTFSDCGTYGITVSSSDSLNKTIRRDIINVFATWDKQIIIKSRETAQVIAGSTFLIVNGRNRKPDGIRFFSWDFNGDGKYEKDTALSSNALYTYAVPGNYTAICKSFLKNGAVVSDSFFINVIPNNVISLYAYDLKVRDVLTNEIISPNQIVFAGKELFFTADFTKGDTAKVKPLWRIGNSGSDLINSFSFRRSFSDTGTVNIVFSITDSTGASYKDTLALIVNKVINGGAIRGKALYKDKSNHSGIIVRVMSAGTPVDTLYTDNTGLYKSTDGIPQGTYDIIAQDSRNNSEYIPDTVQNVTVIKGMFTTSNMVLEDMTGPHFTSATPSDYLFNDSLSLSAQIIDLGSGADQSSFVLTVNDTVVNRTGYTPDGLKLQYTSKVNYGNYNIKATVKDSAGNMSDTIKWTFSRVDTSALRPLKTGDSIEISVNDSVLFFPYNKWLNEKTHKFTVLIDNNVLFDSLNVTNAKFVFKTEGNYTVRYTELLQGKELQNGIAHVNVIKDAPAVSLPQDTLIELNTSITLKSKVSQKFGRIVSYVWKTGDSVIKDATSDFLVTQPESLPGVKKTYILTCTDDDNNIASDTMDISFGKWVVLGNKGFTDTADFQSMTICNGTPYVAYRTNGLFNMYLMCMKFTGTSWVYAGDTVNKLVMPFSINSGGNEPVIAFADMVSGVEPIVYTELKSGFWKKDTSLKGTEFTPDVLDSNAISLQIYNNDPYISYVNWIDSIGYLIKRNMGVWEKVTEAPFADGHALKASLQISNGVPYVAYLYSSVNSRNLYLKMLYSNQWNTLGTGSVQDNVYKYSFCMNNDIPCIATINNESRNLSVKCFINNQWKDISSPYDGTCSYISLHSFRNHLFIAYNVSSDQNRATVKMLDGDNWIDAGYVSDGASQYISMASDSNNLYVVYSDGQVDYRTTVMQLK